MRPLSLTFALGTAAVSMTVACAQSGAPAAAPGPRPASVLVAANMNAGSVSIVDVATGAARATLPTPEGPHEVAISHDARWAVVSIYGNRASVGSSLLVIDLAAGREARRIELGDSKRPHGMAFLPGDRQLLVTSEATQRVLIVDFVRGVIDTAIATGQAATHMVALVPDGSRAFTTNISPGTISVLDVPGRRVEKTITVGARIEGIAVTPNGKEVWVGGNESKLVYVIDVASGTVAAKIDGFGFPYRLGITRDGRTAVVSDPGAEQVHIVDVATRKIRATIAIPPIASGGASPQGVAIGPDDATAFVTLKAAGQVAVIDIATARIVKTLQVGGGSDGIGVSTSPARP